MKWDDLSIADLSKLHQVCRMSNYSANIPKEKQKANSAIVLEAIRRMDNIRNDLHKQLQDKK